VLCHQLQGKTKILEINLKSAGFNPSSALQLCAEDEA
jgi:hypothetical protein